MQPVGGTLAVAVAPPPVGQEQATRCAYRWRGGAAVLLVWCLFLAGVGLAWDIRWHLVVGRDDFWSPPHLLIYGGVAASGLVCLTAGLVATYRAWRDGPMVAHGVRLLGRVHAPLGVVIAGTGLAVVLLAAPFDNLWHELYGIDVALWAPFHLMGLIGGAWAGLGAVYLVAAQAVQARRQGGARPGPLGLDGWQWLLLFALAALYAELAVIAQPGAVQFPTTELGPVQFSTYPVLLALATTFVGAAAVRATGRPGAATAVLALYLARQLLLALLVPGAIRAAVAAQGLSYRLPDGAPRFPLHEVLVALALLGPALVLDLVAWRAADDLRRPRVALGAGLLAGVPLFALATATTFLLYRAVSVLQVPPEIVLPGPPAPEAVELALPLALAAGALGAALGSGLGGVLRLNPR
jgi:hypothetical protein